jgi:SSS family solute:Na+ symporter
MGGLTIDIITDFIQFWIIIIVFTILAILGLKDIGSLHDVIAKQPSGHLDPFAFGGVGWFVGIVLLSGWLFLGNTSHWQRIFSADSPSTARKSFVLAIPFMLILSAIILLIGLEAAILLHIPDKNQAIFAFMDKVLPTHIKGIGYAAILAVIMSSIDSYLVGGSAIIFKVFFEQKKDISVLTARLITMTFGFAGFLIAYLIPDIVKLSLLITYLALIFVPAILAGLYSKRTSAQASFYSILIPTIVLFIGFWKYPKSIFLLTTLLSIIIVIFWDKVFKPRNK